MGGRPDKNGADIRSLGAVHIRLAKCHPERKHYYGGLCVSCANSKWRSHSAKAWKKHLEANRRWGKSEHGRRLKIISHYKRIYKLAIEVVDAMLKRQNNRCAICLQVFKRRPVVDHDHKTGTVRGLLCHRCNSGLGHVERPGFVEAARSYLMPVSGLEAFADGVTRFEGWDPLTRSYQNRNPGNLRRAVHVDAGITTSYEVDDKGYVIFPDFPTGYNALLRDLRAKFTGQNSHGLGPSSTLLSMMKIYAPSSDSNNPEEYAQFLAKWLSVALKKPITIESELCNIWSPPVPLPPPEVKAA